MNKKRFVQDIVRNGIVAMEIDSRDETSDTREFNTGVLIDIAETCWDALQETKYACERYASHLILKASDMPLPNPTPYEITGEEDWFGDMKSSPYKIYDGEPLYYWEGLLDGVCNGWRSPGATIELKGDADLLYLHGIYAGYLECLDAQTDEVSKAPDGEELL